MDTVSKWIDYVNKASAASLLAVVLFTGYSGVWVWGKDYAAMVAERDEWKGVALKAVRAGESLLPGVAGMAPPAPTLSGVKDRVRALEGTR